MRLLFVSNLHPPVVRGGYEVECATTADHLRRAGHEVTVLTSREVPAAAGVLPALPRLSSDARGALAAPAAAVLGARAARAAVERTRPDLVYVWNASGLPWTALLALHESGRPVAYRVCEHWFGRVFTEGDQFLRYLDGEGSAAERAWGSLCRAVARHPAVPAVPRTPLPAAVSWVTAALRELAGVPAAIDIRHEEVMHAVSRNAAAVEQVVRRPSAGPPTLLFTGRLSEEKGATIAVDALAALRDRHGIRARLVLAGPGDPALLARRAADLGLADAVELPGSLDTAALVERLGTAAVALVPSVWDDPGPLTCIEAALAGVPVVAARVGGIPELLRDGEEALLHPRGDALACAALIAETLENPSAAADRAERARERWQRFRLGDYLAAQERFVDAAVRVLSAA